MSSGKSLIGYYEIEDGDFFVIELYDSDESLIQRIVIKRDTAIELAEGILETLGKY